MDVMWEGYKNYDHYYTCGSTHEINEFFEEVAESKPEIIQVGKEYVWNIPCSFDIETSSFKIFGDKKACLYLWCLNINGSSIIGRTWKQFRKIINRLSVAFKTEKQPLIIYVHNLGYEFQWMRKWFHWKDVFAVKERRPVRAEMTNGIIFKCSYILSNYALAYLGKNIVNKYLVQKDVGAVDYSLIRTPATSLTSQEIWYNVHDCQVVTSFIQEKIENEGGINKIPLTNTGYVRQYCREFCFTQFKSDPKIARKLKARYHERMKSLQIVSQCEYDQLHWAFGGGFTHASPTYSGQVVHNVGSADLASSYPAVMVMKKFPMGRGTFIGKVTEDELNKILNGNSFCALFTVTIKNIYPKFRYDNYISVSRCQILSKDAVINNGRVAQASELQLTVTEQDWDIIKRCYEWNDNDLEINNLRIYPADYLPKPFILSILHLFGNKTSLKGIKEKVTEYMVSKNMINAAYGMTVTAIIRDLYEYSEEGWKTEGADQLAQIKSYNNNYNRFLFYAWGVWVTAHARHNLWEAIFEFGKDYIYSDTDSIKGLNFKDHELFFSLYNMKIHSQLSDMCKYWKIDMNLCTPKTIEGKKKMIGVWEIEESYKTFKTIGAKRYIYEYENGFLNFTVSGVNKKYGVPYLLKEFSNPNFFELYKTAYNPTRDEEEQKLDKKATEHILKLHEEGQLPYEKIFEVFNEALYFPAEYTGKQTLTYIDNPTIEMIIDYQGNQSIVHEESMIHMEPQSYYMSQTWAYKRFLMGFRDASI